MSREQLKCDCHARAIMAEREGWKLIIRDRQFGETHTLVFDIREEYNRLKQLEEMGELQDSRSSA